MNEAREANRPYADLSQGRLPARDGRLGKSQRTAGGDRAPLRMEIPAMLLTYPRERRCKMQERAEQETKRQKAEKETLRKQNTRKSHGPKTKRQEPGPQPLGQGKKQKTRPLGQNPKSQEAWVKRFRLRSGSKCEAVSAKRKGLQKSRPT